MRTKCNPYIYKTVFYQALEMLFSNFVIVNLLITQKVQCASNFDRRLFSTPETVFRFIDSNDKQCDDTIRTEEKAVQKQGLENDEKSFDDADKKEECSKENSPLEPLDLDAVKDLREKIKQYSNYCFIPNRFPRILEGLKKVPLGTKVQCRATQKGRDEECVLSMERINQAPQDNDLDRTKVCAKKNVFLEKACTEIQAFTDFSDSCSKRMMNSLKKNELINREIIDWANPENINIFLQNELLETYEKTVNFLHIYAKLVNILEEKLKNIQLDIKETNQRIIEYAEKIESTKEPVECNHKLDKEIETFIKLRKSKEEIAELCDRFEACGQKVCTAFLAFKQALQKNNYQMEIAKERQ